MLSSFLVLDGRLDQRKKYHARSESNLQEVMKLKIGPRFPEGEQMKKEALSQK